MAVTVSPGGQQRQGKQGKQGGAATFERCNICKGRISLYALMDTTVRTQSTVSSTKAPLTERRAKKQVHFTLQTPQMERRYFFRIVSKPLKMQKTFFRD